MGAAQEFQQSSLMNCQRQFESCPTRSRTCASAADADPKMFGLLAKSPPSTTTSSAILSNGTRTRNALIIFCASDLLEAYSFGTLMTISSSPEFMVRMAVHAATEDMQAAHNRWRKVPRPGVQCHL